MAEISPLFLTKIQDSVTTFFNRPDASIMRNIMRVQPSEVVDFWFRQNRPSNRPIIVDASSGVVGSTGTDAFTSRETYARTRIARRIYGREQLAKILGNENSPMAQQFLHDVTRSVVQELRFQFDVDVIASFDATVTAKTSMDAVPQVVPIPFDYQNQYLGYDYTATIVGNEPNYVQRGLSVAKLERAKQMIRSASPRQNRLFCATDSWGILTLKGDPRANMLVTPAEKSGVLALGDALLDRQYFQGEVYDVCGVTVVETEAVPKNVQIGDNAKPNPANPTAGTYAYVYDPEQFVVSVNQDLRVEFWEEKKERSVYVSAEHRYDSIRLDEKSIVKIGVAY